MSIRDQSWVVLGLALFLMGLPGCQSLQKTLVQMKNGAFKKTDTAHGSTVSVKKSKTSGYLAQGRAYSSPVLPDSQTDIPEKSATEEAESKAVAVRELKDDEKEKNGGGEKSLEEQVREESATLKSQYEKKIEDLKAALDQEKKNSDQLQKKAMQLEMELLKKSQETDRMRLDVMSKQAAFNAQYPGFYEVAAGDSLWKIASMGNIYKNPFKWIEIFYANQDKVANPDLIYPGLVLKIPRYLEMLLGSVETSKATDGETGAAVEKNKTEETPETEEAEPKTETKQEAPKAKDDLDEEL